MESFHEYIVDEKLNLKGLPLADMNSPFIDCFCIIRKIETGNIHTTSWRTKNTICTYEFYNSRREKTIININGWKLINITEPNWKNTWEHIEIKIEDPLGQMRQFKDGNPLFFRYSHKIEGNKLVSEKFFTTYFSWEEEAALQALKLLKEISKWKSWESFDFFIENQMLSDGIDFLIKNK